MNTLLIREACSHLREGGVIAYPTEAVWGLGCDPWNEQAVLRILELKEREVEKGLIIVAADEQQIQPLLESLDASQRQALRATWPGPVTWLIQDPEGLYPGWVKGEHKSIAIRISAHPLVHALCREFGKPIISTSANKAGEPEIRSRLRIDEQFSSSIDFILDGELGDSSQPSQIRDLQSGTILR